MIVLGGVFWILPEIFKFEIFPHILGNETATVVVVTLRKMMGGDFVFIGTLSFSFQETSKYTAQELIFSSAAGYFFIFGTLLHTRLS